jgi:integrase
MEKPRAPRREATWLEAARVIRLQRADLAIPFLYELLATYVLTGGRRAEVLGLEVSDINFERQTVTFRPNAWRRLKSGTSARTVRLWPQLAEVLRRYLNARVRDEVLAGRPARRLLFPSGANGREQMVHDFRKALLQVTRRLGWKDGEVTPKSFRHTYCSARLQTWDRGAPVSIFTVGRELGHGGDSLVKRIYGHLGEHRHRSEVVKYRVEDFPHLVERVEALRFVTETATVVDSGGRNSLRGL